MQNNSEDILIEEGNDCIQKVHALLKGTPVIEDLGNGARRTKRFPNQVDFATDCQTAIEHSDPQQAFLLLTQFIAKHEISGKKLAQYQKSEPEKYAISQQILLLYLQCHALEAAKAIETLNKVFKDAKLEALQDQYDPFVSSISILLDSVNGLMQHTHANTQELYGSYCEKLGEECSRIKKDLTRWKESHQDQLTRAAETPLEHLQVAAYYLFRGLDYIVTGMLWCLDELRIAAGLTNEYYYTEMGERSSVRPMKDTGTPGAQSIVGRSHFFQLPAKDDRIQTMLDAMNKFYTEIDLVKPPEFPYR